MRFWDVFLDDFFLSLNVDIADSVKELTTRITAGIEENISGEIHQNFTEELKNVGFNEKFQKFRDNLHKQGKFLNNVLEMIECLLIFLRSTRQQLWELHLASLNRFTKYFFALDLLNYARMTPIQLSSMNEIRINYAESWNFLERNFLYLNVKVPS